MPTTIPPVPPPAVPTLAYALEQVDECSRKADNYLCLEIVWLCGAFGAGLLVLAWHWTFVIPMLVFAVATWLTDANRHIFTKAQVHWEEQADAVRYDEGR